ncbi:putative ap-2 adaptor complex subunit [Phaeomoniella chlamydospora]|uniref:AP-2 complex subunit sigma n=1 Tax=Phaeomoniella chlamydospora TaxID=158046 RepID=A0A0G2G1K6_PHACM|nr:putative ap-2 adaptor complex subunit [Phaeomoniella chlamydospora]
MYRSLKDRLKRKSVGNLLTASTITDAPRRPLQQDVVGDQSREGVDDNAQNGIANRISAAPKNNGDDVVVALMGMTGSGKSSFIKAVTGNGNVVVGNTLESETAVVSSFTCKIQGISFVLVDTPGFNDTYRSEREILNEITTWLSMTYTEGRLLNGVVYLHPISHCRVEGSSFLSLRMLMKLLDRRIGQAREQELCKSSELWGYMRSKGAQVVQIHNYVVQAKEILLEIAQKGTVVLDIQKELVDEKKEVKDTNVGKLADYELAKVQREAEQEAQHARRKAARKLAQKEAELTEKMRQQKAAQEKLEREQRQLFEEQKLQQEKLQKALQQEAKRRALEEQQKKDRLEAQMREHLHRQMEEKKQLEEENRRRERQLRLEEDRLRRSNNRARRLILLPTQLSTLERAQNFGLIQARILGIDTQSPAFNRSCDYCFGLIGFQPYKRPILAMTEDMCYTRWCVRYERTWGKTRLAKWYAPYNDEEKVKLKGEVHRLIAPRDQKYQSNFVEFRRSTKIVYRRYAGLFFCVCVDANDNELAYLEAIHFFVEVLDQFFGNVCELDLVFNFYKVYAILDEVFLAGEIEETSKQVVLTRLEHLDKLE